MISCRVSRRGSPTTFQQKNHHQELAYHHKEGGFTDTCDVVHWVSQKGPKSPPPSFMNENLTHPAWSWGACGHCVAFALAVVAVLRRHAAKQAAGKRHAAAHWSMSVLNSNSPNWGGLGSLSPRGAQPWKGITALHLLKRHLSYQGPRQCRIAEYDYIPSWWPVNRRSPRKIVVGEGRGN